MLLLRLQGRGIGHGGNLKPLGIAVVILAVAFAIWGVIAEVFADYEYSNQIESFWSLSVKASTLEQKTTYLDQFVSAIGNARLSPNDAVFLKTPDNSVEQNLIALKSLQNRMHEIKAMDVQSFQYQQAISQITAQEQGEAEHLLGVIEGAWYLENHPLLWQWYDLLKWLTLFVFGLTGVGLIASDPY